MPEVEVLVRIPLKVPKGDEASGRWFLEDLFEREIESSEIGRLEVALREGLRQLQDDRSKEDPDSGFMDWKFGQATYTVPGLGRKRVEW